MAKATSYLPEGDDPLAQRRGGQIDPVTGLPVEDDVVGSGSAVGPAVAPDVINGAPAVRGHVDTGQIVNEAPAPVVQPSQPTTQPTGPAPASWADPPQAASPTDPFAAMGGGVMVNGGWVPKDHPLAQQAGASGSGGTGTSSSESSSTSSSGVADTTDGLARQALMELLKTPATMDPAALQSSPAMRAARMAGQRGEERQRAQLAEKASAEGWGSSGAFDSGVAGIREARGANEAGIAGTLAIQELQNNRDTLTNAINLANQQGQFEQSQALQRELASIDSALRSQGISSAEGIANNRLGFDYTALQADMNYKALLAALAGAGGGV